ncbi:VOC family protein [Brevibacillus centrosporus]|jgi:PhnB protein|uniref:PhnB protein n=1 Tax=Brevibacillus centrosporus TaxID=54910 RepID=A0A1I4CSD0_9BACL|nr:VOC family protein [Brevibacillus centrosporus]MEC2132157.1 VOC family protein [Brevibacillus centrosporus]MED1954010.1 VOC family protein [Brevibacillus centrosporus]MED4911895.1 VOC family protein [Brevibacillus centrosporus]RNB68741.1 VOC family protein [Brevibacillus centrosporus]SFK83147.1 PhnB protein [Brevibacillus centrosporus]
MIVNPFIVVDNCSEEIKYYQSVFGGEIVILRKQGDVVLNADLHVEGATLKFADTQAAKPIGKGDYVRVFLRIETEEEFRKIYGEFATDGTVHTEVYEAPFNGLLAIVSDRNGVCWVLSYYRE